MAVEEFCDFTRAGMRCIGPARHPQGQHQLSAASSATAQAIERQRGPARFHETPEQTKARRTPLALDAVVPESAEIIVNSEIKEVADALKLKEADATVQGLG